MNKYQLALTVLDKALTTRRPHGADATRKFCNWLMKLLPSPMVDAAGNIHVDLRGTTGHSLFVAHVDTVHRHGGRNKVVKTAKQWSAVGAPLGADDGAGVAILCHMIYNQVPGYYVFTQGEERGGIGATWLAENMRDLLSQFKRAIAFDRRATYSVITHQGWGRCCSDTFAEALSDAFNRRGMLFMPDDTGVYTDTAEFVGIIPECTNISAGYDMEHTDRETLDMVHFMELCKYVVKVDWDALPVVRDPHALDTLDTLDTLDLPRGMLGAELGNDGYRPAVYDLDTMQALDDAFDGKLNPLVELIAKTASPDSPRTAEKQIDRRRITESFLVELLQDASVVDSDTLLLTAFDEIGVGAWV